MILAFNNRRGCQVRALSSGSASTHWTDDHGPNYGRIFTKDGIEEKDLGQFAWQYIPMFVYVPRVIVEYNDITGLWSRGLYGPTCDVVSLLWDRRYLDTKPRKKKKKKEGRERDESFIFVWQWETRAIAHTRIASPSAACHRIRVTVPLINLTTNK